MLTQYPTLQSLRDLAEANIAVPGAEGSEEGS
jgi:hypothetical protein